MKKCVKETVTFVHDAKCRGFSRNKAGARSDSLKLLLVDRSTSQSEGYESIETDVYQLRKHRSKYLSHIHNQCCLEPWLSVASTDVSYHKRTCLRYTLLPQAFAPVQTMTLFTEGYSEVSKTSSMPGYPCAGAPIPAPPTISVSLGTNVSTTLSCKGCLPPWMLLHVRDAGR